MKTTITQIAKKGRLSLSGLSNILTGNRRPSWPTAKRLEAATGISAVDWIDGRVDREYLNNHYKEREAA
jgi:transcriptional regulator with XRE-family HTH domain